MRVHFSEFRQIRRNDRTIKWLAGETYDYDPDMEPMIKIGHARLVPEDAPDPATEGVGADGGFATVAAAPGPSGDAPERRRGRQAGPDGVISPPRPAPAPTPGSKM